MSIIYPSTPAFMAINFKLDDPTTSFRSQNMKRIARKASGQMWSFTIAYPPISSDNIRNILGAIAKARGSYQTFTVTPPNLSTPRGTQTSNTTVATTTAVGATSVPITGASTNTFKAGDILKFSNHTKVYTITDDTTAVAGAATLSISPPLIVQVTGSSTTVQHSNVSFTVSLASDLQEIKTDVFNLSSYQLDVEEVF